MTLRAFALSALTTSGLALGAAAPSGPAEMAPQGELIPVFRASGVRDSPGAATVAHCANLGAVTREVFVTFFEFNGTVDCSLQFDVAPDETRTFASRATAVYVEDATCNPAPDTQQGSLRVALEFPTDLACTVQILDPVAATPTFLDRLSLYDGNGLYLGFNIFADGFESGDTSAWSATVD